MPNRTIRTVAACLLLPLCLAAQEDRSQDGTPLPPRERGPAVVVSLAFPGGTVPQFAAALVKAGGNSRGINIVIAPLAEQATVPPLELQGADVEQALDTACLVAEGPVEVRVKCITGGGQPIYMILAREKTPRAGAAADAHAIVQRVFTLNQLTMPRPGGLGVEPLAVETILSAVELVASVDGQGPVLRYHKDSGLLLVRGTPMQVSQAEEAIAVLGSDLDAREAYARQRGGFGTQAAPATEGGR